MQQTGQTAEFTATGPSAMGWTETGVGGAGLAGMGLTATSETDTERKRVEAVVETLANLRCQGESLAEVAHDARNMVTALGLYCDLLAEPGVLSPAFLHYANELRLVATASRRLVEKLLALDIRLGSASELNHAAIAEHAGAEPLSPSRMAQARHWDLLPARPIENLADELLSSRNLLSALAGPSIALTIDVEGGALPVRLTGEDLTRILVNLVKNAAEAMPEGGRISVGLHEFHAGETIPPWLMLSVEDSGPGIPRKSLEKIFDSGFTTRAGACAHGGHNQGGWPASHRGLGLSITRSIVETSGGRIHAVHRALTGARFEIELPVRPR
ncbi:MAG: sensor histidine kinase [Terracidiphilus sp.]|jgi:signal transduction histidine kinase